MWVPASAEEIEQAAQTGRLAEKKSFEAKREVGRNKDVAIDVNALALDWSMRRPPRGLALCWLCIASVLAAAGCGGDGNTPTATGGPPLGAAAYGERANAICAKAFAKERAVPHSSSTGNVSFDRNFGQVVEIRGRALRELQALRPPPADAASVARMLRYLANGQSFLLRAVRLGKSGMMKPKPGLVAAAKADQNNQKGRGIARSLGLSRCATF